ncbi:MULTISPECIES: 30S ribosome-binding factor RbfA [Spongiibacter]|jgi:ribosome-binding factor A|uniref:30S ribosome-binding factor RbfA n=1 Tax=Spongiibacter TaxID=630749 RepID=UPI0004004AE7|nr:MULTISPECIES: 30S ribosome-binding factor RbfA [Spongiibacter]MAK42811.1 30S ribosome-binding factor RbfA [Spongiibacter sp.]MBM7423493.1 ribosome-binding factor A [Spongiibacter marinus]MEE2654096.1 30S ribosome-binding factor RbfA [Pseudomonadota bacterium]|tara:strand:+ start:43073 stop:43462 length:390 start_codon:yes stop_codon:yes gene_type:complete
MKEFSRTARIADFLKRELGSLIQLELRDPRIGMVSVTDAEVSRDLSHAKIFVTVMGKDNAEEAAESLAALNKAAGFLRSHVAKVNNARTTPQLRFFYDSSIDRGQRLSSLIQQAVDSDRSRQADNDDEA